MTACSAAKFGGVHSLDIHIPDNLGGADCTEIYFVGIKGEFYVVRLCAYEFYCSRDVIACLNAAPVSQQMKVLLVAEKEGGSSSSV
jgi:hypothetical protein